MPLVCGVTLNVACPIIASLPVFSAVKNTSFCSPRCTVTLRCSGSKRHGKPGATLLSNSTVTVFGEIVAELESTLCVVPP